MTTPFGRPRGPDVRGALDLFVAQFGNFRRIVPIGIGIIVLIILGSGVYIVGPGEVGVVRTFGRETGQTQPGPHYKIPFAQSVDVVNIAQIRRIEVGHRDKQKVQAEAQMLTGDENIVEAQMTVQYRVREPSKYLFELKDADETLRATAEVALRSMVGRTKVDDIMTTGREKVQAETRTFLQHLMDTYQSGLLVTEVKLQSVDAPDEVKEAFHDVVRAREEKEKLINQAHGYRADQLPRAKGEAVKMEREAEGYKQQRVLRANGDASKFLSMYSEYSKAERVTRQRLYLETMERIFSRVENKVVIDGALARGTLPILPIGAPGVAPTNPPPLAGEKK